MTGKKLILVKNALFIKSQCLQVQLYPKMGKILQEISYYKILLLGKLSILLLDTVIHKKRVSYFKILDTQEKSI